MSPKGNLVIDQGAVDVLKSHGRSLLPVGVTLVEGQFSRGDMVSCRDSSGTEVARGLVNYNQVETKKIIGHASEHIEEKLGYLGDDELIHRDNMVLV